MIGRLSQSVALLVSLAVAVVLNAAAPDGESTTFVFDRLNGTYLDLGGDVSEIQSGPITVRASSSSNRFQLIGNRLELTPLRNGNHRAKFWVHFEGEADVEAEVSMGPLSGGKLEDKVTVPRQERTIRSQIKLERRGEDYLITVVRSPKEFDITIRSRLAGQLVSMCEGLTRFAFGSNCDGLEAALSNPKVPMPEPGRELVLEADQLTAEEKLQLDSYLDSSGESVGAEPRPSE